MCMVRRHFYLACLPLYHNSTILQPMETRITKYHGAHIGSQDPHCTLFIKKKILQENWPLSVISFISYNLSLCAYQISFSSKFDKKALVHWFIKMIFLHLLSVLSYLDLFSILSCLWQIINIFFFYYFEMTLLFNPTMKSDLPYTSKQQNSFSALATTIRLSVALISKSSSSLSPWNFVEFLSQSLYRFGKINYRLIP